MPTSVAIVVCGSVIFVIAILANMVIRVITVAKGGGAKSGQRVSELEGDVARLEQDLDDAISRIVVLEKIVTDDKYNLSKQIDDLAANQD